MHSLQAPEPLLNEHRQFTDELGEAVQSNGRLGVIAQELIDLLTPHFQIEEETAFPPLTLLVPLSRGEITPDMKNAMVLIDRLKNELPRLSSDHEEVTRKLSDFDDAARAEGKVAFLPFAPKLLHHAKAEEGILYPAAFLIGEYLRLKL